MTRSDSNWTRVGAALLFLAFTVGVLDVIDQISHPAAILVALAGAGVVQVLTRRAA